MVWFQTLSPIPVIIENAQSKKFAWRTENNSRLGHPLLLILARIYIAENVFASWFRAEDNLYLFLDYAAEGTIKKVVLLFC